MRRRSRLLFVAALLLGPRTAHSDDHAAHHPEGAASASAAGGMGGGGMGGGMDAMMAGMMKPTSAGAKFPESGGCVGGDCGSASSAKPIYPQLMTLPALTPERRAEIDALATTEINAGLAELAKGSEALNHATQTSDNAAAQQAIGVMREGLDQLEAGIAARRVLTEGKAPRNLALDWFKREMNLASPVAREEPHAAGLSVFHIFTMVLLALFALAMMAMYFFKMRRAAALFGRIESDSGKPPPGSPPPAKPDTPAPSAPPKEQRSGATPPAPTVPPATLPANPPAAPPPPAATTPTAPPKDPTNPTKPPESPTAPATPAATPPPPPTATSTPTDAVPVKANWRGKLRVASIIDETRIVRTFRLVSEDGLLPFTYVPGQFLNTTFWIGGAKMNRSYSISSSPTARDHVDLTIKREERGAVSRHTNDLLKIADSIEIGGPVGKTTFTGAEAESVVLISGGVGVTPMMSISRFLTERAWPGEIFFIFACRAPADFIFRKDLEALERRNPKLHVVVTMSGAGAEWTGRRGRITKELLTETVPNLAARRIHLCGPPTMMAAVKAIFTELGVPVDAVKTEAFGTPKPPPSPAGTSAKAVTAATGPLVTFSKNSKSAKIHIDQSGGDSPPLQSILELSEELGIGIEFACRVGTCGLCKVKMTSGEVDMAVQDALEDADKTNGIILACQAKPKGAVTVEA